MKCEMFRRERGEDLLVKLKEILYVHRKNQLLR